MWNSVHAMPDFVAIYVPFETYGPVALTGWE